MCINYTLFFSFRNTAFTHQFFLRAAFCFLNNKCLIWTDGLTAHYKWTFTLRPPVTSMAFFKILVAEMHTFYNNSNIFIIGRNPSDSGESSL